MPEVGGVGLFVAFAAGLLSCASPCVLPLVPAYWLSDRHARPPFPARARRCGRRRQARAGPSPFFHA